MHTVGFLLVFALPLGLAVMYTRGNTVLHVAARREEPSITVQFLNKGAIASEPTFEGEGAVTICRRLTRPKDYQMKREKGQEANKDQICIEVLERETCGNPTAGDASISSLAVADDLHMKLLCLEDRVAFARMFFPTEAKLAMEIAHAETTSELAGLLSSRGSSGNLVEVDLNETPITQNKRLLSRIETLSRTVEVGRRYFPHCLQVWDKFLEDGLPDAFYLEKGTPEGQRMKRMRFMELKDEVQKTFNEGKTSGCSETGLNLEIISLSKLSSSLGQLLCDSSSDFSDADIVVEDSSVGIHRCILAARSKFFDYLFMKNKGFVGKEGKPKYYMTHFLPYGKIGYEAFVIFLSYLYTGKLRSSPLEVSTCVDNVCPHDACRPAIDFAVELMYASTIFQVTELVSLFQHRLLNLIGKAIIEDVIPILLVAFHCQLYQLLTQCVQRVARSDLETISIEKELPYKVAKDIRLLRFSF